MSLFSIYPPLLLFLLGLCVGSFSNVLIEWTVGERKSFVYPPSFCDHCKHRLGLWDLIPVFSFVFLKGRCRYCGKKIPFQYPLVELATGILFLLSPYSLFPIPYSLFLFSLFIVIFVADLVYGIIPDRVILPATLLTLPYSLFVIRHSLFTALAIGFFFFLLYFASKGKALGFGDVKLAFFLGLTLGFPRVLMAVYLAVLLGGLIAGMLLILGKKKLRDEIPLGPFLVAGSILTMFLGDSVLKFLIFDI